LGGLNNPDDRKLQLKIFKKLERAIKADASAASSLTALIQGEGGIPREAKGMAMGVLAEMASTQGQGYLVDILQGTQDRKMQETSLFQLGFVQHLTRDTVDAVRRIAGEVLTVTVTVNVTGTGTGTGTVTGTLIGGLTRHRFEQADPTCAGHLREPPRAERGHRVWGEDRPVHPRASQNVELRPCEAAHTAA
jgi:hypothetical protein